MTARIKALLGAGLIAAASNANAQTIGFDQICPPDKTGNRTFSPTLLMMAVLDAYQPSRHTLDIDGDGNETEVERLRVMLGDGCAVTDRCEADADKITKAQNALASVFERTDLIIVRLRPPATDAERKNETWLDTRPARGAAGSISELVDPARRFLSVTCKSAQNGTSTPVTPPPAPKPRPSLRLTSKLEELTRSSDTSLETIDAATISIAKDNVGNKLTFAIDGILGVNIPLGGEMQNLVPFIQYQRTSVRDRSVTPPTTTRSPDKLGLGVVATIRVATNDPVDIAPIYVVDYEKGSRVLSVKANWIPGFLRRIDDIAVGRAQPVVTDLLYYRVTPRVLLQGSHVFEAGTNTDLLTTSDYLRIGGDASLDLWGAGPLDKFTASVSYKRLFRLTKGPRDVSLLKTNIQYWLDPDGHVSIGYTYEHGLDEDTTTRVNDWKIDLGVRF